MPNVISQIKENDVAHDIAELVVAVGDGDIVRVRSLIDAGVPINGAADNGTTSLMRAASEAHLDLARLLLDNGADLNARRDDGFTALMLAVFFGHEDVVRELLERGADVTLESRFGSSAEVWATARGFEGIRRLLELARNGRAPERVELPLEAQPELHPDPPETAGPAPLPSAPGDPVGASLSVTDDEEVTLESKPIVVGDDLDPRNQDTAAGQEGFRESRANLPREWPAASIFGSSTPTPPQLPPSSSPALLFVADITSTWKRVGVLTCILMLFSALIGLAIVKAREIWLRGDASVIARQSPEPLSEQTAISADTPPTTTRSTLKATPNRAQRAINATSLSVNKDGAEIRARAQTSQSVQAKEKSGRANANALPKPTRANTVSSMQSGSSKFAGPIKPGSQPTRTSAKMEPAVNQLSSSSLHVVPSDKGTGQLKPSAANGTPDRPRVVSDAQAHSSTRGSDDKLLIIPTRKSKTKVIQWP